LLSVVLAVYLVMALLISNDMAAREVCRGVDVEVEQSGASRNFVTTDEVRRLLEEWGFDKKGEPLVSIDLQSIEDKLDGIVNIEHSIAERTADGRVRVKVVPMIPVARVFDRNGSYYINRSGKRLTAGARFRLDVPIVSGHFDSVFPATKLLPLIEHVSRDSSWNSLVAQIIVEPHDHDVILVPMIRGHVINLGDTSNITDKLSRVMTMYRKVLPLKGWNYYDTLSVKWGGQVVASRRVKSIPEPLIKFDQEGDYTEDESIDNMLVGDTVALAGQETRRQ